MDSNNNNNAKAKAKSQKNNHPSSLPSPRHSHSHSSSSSSSCSNNNNNNNTPPLPVTPTTPYPPKPITRSDSGNPYPTTFVQADPSNFKQVVQMLTGSPETVRKAAEPLAARNHHHIPPIKTIPRKPNQPQSGFKLYERRNSLKNLNLNPLLPVFSPKPTPTPTTGGGFFPSPRNHHHPEILSPSILDFPALVLSPVTPLIPDPFNRSAVVTGNNNNNYGCGNGNGNGNGRMNDMNSPKMSTEGVAAAAAEEEERAIREKGFYLHPSPRATTPRDAEPRLLPLFPTTSPTASSAPSTPPPSN